jgi:hypothetical protein
MITALLSLMLTTAATQNPLDPVLPGKQLCTAPDESEKHCQAIDTFRLLPGGRYSITSTARIALDDRSITFTSTDVAVVKEGALCRVALPRSVSAEQIKVTGKPLTALQLSTLRKLLAAAEADYVHKEMCIVIEESDEGLVGRTKVNGAYDPGLEIFVKWVDPSEGYHLIR